MKTKLITLPNLVTLANLLCGMVAVIAMISLQSGEALRIAFILMSAAAVFDFLDGFVARLTKQYSPIGVQLDSLADMVSFGVLPTIIAMKIYYLSGGHGAWSAVMLIIVVCVALRLAKFNVSDDQKTEFRGLPVPACALLIGSAGYIVAHMPQTAFGASIQWIALAAAVVLGLLMLTDVRMFSLKFEGFGFIRNATRYVFLLMSLILIVLFGVGGVGLSVILYIVASLLMGLTGRRA